MKRPLLMRLGFSSWGGPGDLLVLVVQKVGCGRVTYGRIAICPYVGRMIFGEVRMVSLRFK